MSTYRLDAHQSRRTQHRADFAEEKKYTSSFHPSWLPLPGPSFCPHKFHKNSLDVRSQPLLKPRTRREKRSPPSLKFNPRKKTKTPSVLLLQPKRPASLRHRQLRHFPFECSPKFRTGPDISSPHSKISSSTGIFSSA
ncbi:hypothetical protein AVEN_196004-1 [Araneus ventricosus]|uniref:Uncharacterized protein n=1 Tax=Araneus ventricosus TaxID=182803 RepID=A0A4Y2DRA3_ARAVE|nr:hypothetical protein AVEN_196004-1 [Araneus ventricosus]